MGLERNGKLLFGPTLDGGVGNVGHSGLLWRFQRSYGGETKRFEGDVNVMRMKRMQEATRRRREGEQVWCRRGIGQ